MGFVLLPKLNSPGEDILYYIVLLIIIIRCFSRPNDSTRELCRIVELRRSRPTRITRAKKACVVVESTQSLTAAPAAGDDKKEGPFSDTVKRLSAQTTIVYKYGNAVSELLYHLYAKRPHDPAKPVLSCTGPLPLVLGHS